MRLWLQNKPGGFPVRLFSLRTKAVGIVAALLLINVAARAADEIHPLMPEYCKVLVTYACHAKSLWHAEANGGYWGDRLDAKDQNGAVRGTCNTLLAYAMLVHAQDNGLLSPDDVKTLNNAGLDRHHLVEQIRLNLAYLTAHHKSAGAELVPPVWGYGWQTSLWMQSLGMGALLVWDDLGDDLKKDVARVAGAEADWVGSHPPKDFAKGDTGAEENAWNTGAPALALALMPDATSATLWWRTLKTFAANTYSHASDKQSSDPVSQLVSTANLNRDWSLVNHHFFHPDYLQVSGMHLGEAWLILKLGDQRNHTNLADEFEPYSMHNVEAVWQKVLRPLLLPTGEFAYPAGNDWTFHCSTNQGYFAFIATALNSYDAAEAEARGLEHIKARREASPAGRLLGDSNLEWWWEPLVCKRICTAMLHHMVRPGTPRQPAVSATIDDLTTTSQYADVSIWMHRTPQYFFSISSGSPRLGYFVPLGGTREANPYMTLPVKDGLLPDGKWDFRPARTDEKSDVQGGTLWLDGKAMAAVMCMRNSVAVFSRDDFHSMKIENDTLTHPGRTVHSVAGEKVFPALTKSAEVSFPGPWLNVDEALGLIATEGFVWRPACGWNQRSVAMDRVKPRSEHGVWQMLAANSQETGAVANTLIVEETTTGIEALIQDGPHGSKYRARLGDNGFSFESH